jgi:hypothetical protein
MGSKELERLAKTLFSPAFNPFEYSTDDLTVIMAEIFFQVVVILIFICVFSQALTDTSLSAGTRQGAAHTTGNGAEPVALGPSGDAKQPLPQLDPRR